MTATPTAGPRRRPRSLTRNGWIPDQHGAWAMAIAPLVLGVLRTGARPIHALLAVAWLAAFLAFNVIEIWAKTPKRRRSRLTPALSAYGGATAALGIALAIQRPGVTTWAWLYAPLAAVTAGLLVRRKERAVATRALSIVIACLVAPVAASLSLGGGALGDVLPTELAVGDEAVQIWVRTLVLVLYFFGTVLFVRSMIRGRGNRRWERGALVWHVVGAAVLAALAWAGLLGWSILVVWVGLSVRTWAMAALQRSRGTLKPVVIGLSEMAWCAVLTTVLILG